MFRIPTDDPFESESFYNGKYSEGFTTDLPSDVELKSLLSSGFAGLEKDYSKYIAIIRALGGSGGSKLLDFGCSWGYGSYQFAKAGFDTLSYEISRTRREYGVLNLGINALDDFDSWAYSVAAQGSIDIFFSAHVLEHVPSPIKIINLARRVLRPSGLFIAFFPNGSAAGRAANSNWNQLWGKVHPNLLDDIFFNSALFDFPRVFGSTPYNLPSSAMDLLLSKKPYVQYMDSLRGDEIVVATRF